MRILCLMLVIIVSFSNIQYAEAYDTVGRTKKSDKKKEQESKENKSPIFKKNFLFLELNGNYLQGDASKTIDSRNGTTSDKIFLGMGLEFDRFVLERISIGLSYRYLFKKYNETKISGNEYGINAKYYVTDFVKARPYVHFQYGRLSANVENYIQSIDATNYYRIGFGMFSSSGHTLATKIELYYQNVLSSEVNINIGFTNLEYNVSFIGLQFSLGYHL